MREARRLRAAPRCAIERRVRAFLRDKSRRYLAALLARPAFAIAVVVSLGIGNTAHGAGSIDLYHVSLGIGGFVINGNNEDDLSGVFLPGEAGDVNGDGIPDVVIGAPSGGVGQVGESYVVFGKADGTPINLSDVATGIGGFVVNAFDEADGNPFIVSGIGDVNGDELADVVIGAPLADPGGRTNAGKSYVVFGKASNTAVDVADIASGSGGFVINGIDPEDGAGIVSGAGDVNGDGIPDILVGADFADPSGVFQAGESYVVFGKASSTAVNLSDIAAGVGGFIINGEASQDYAGFVSGAGDVNGDGLADVLIGARGDFVSVAGKSYIVFGKSTTTAVNLSDVSSGSGGFLIDSAAGGRLGISVSDAGDVNGDGLADVIVGAPYADPDINRNNAGQSYVVFGKAATDAVDISDVIAGIGGFVINGSDPSDETGWSVSGAGDINGDGYADVIVGAPNTHPGGKLFAGQSYVVFGKPDTMAVELADIASGSGGFAVVGIDAFDESGRFVSGVGDMNGDGLSDVVIGAWQADPNGRMDAGESYVVFGSEEIFEIPANSGFGHAMLALVMAGAGLISLLRIRQRGPRRAVNT